MQVEKCFSPELIGRLSEIIIFEPLTHDELREIVRIQMKNVIATVAEKGVSLFFFFFFKLSPGGRESPPEYIASKEHYKTRHLPTREG